jgi:large subunit ribosomal protein L7Ae
MVEIDEKQVFSLVQKAKESGALKIGANEVTKAVERSQAQLVLTATDVSPAEIVAHFPGLCKEMKVMCFSKGTRAELGSLAGVKSTTAVAITDAGSAKKELEALKAEVLGEAAPVAAEAAETPKKGKKSAE